MPVCNAHYEDSLLDLITLFPHGFCNSITGHHKSYIDFFAVLALSIDNRPPTVTFQSGFRMLPYLPLLLLSTTVNGWNMYTEEEREELDGIPELRGTVVRDGERSREQQAAYGFERKFLTFSGFKWLRIHSSGMLGKICGSREERV